MQKTTAVLIAATLVAGAASAQMKAPPGSVKITQSSGKSTPQLQTITPASPETAKRVDADQASRLVKGGKAVLVDVRSRESYAAEHIQGAVNIPSSELLKRIPELPPGKMIITYCAWPNEETSARAVLDLNAHGVKNAAALEGGMNAWRAAKLPLVK